MTGEARPDNDPQLSMAARIDVLCDEFEALWRAGKHPRLEDYLPRSPRGFEDTLLAELLQTELELRQEAGESLRLDELHGRFPSHPHLVDSVYRQVVRPRRLGDYELLDRQGRGGMGEVYRARHTLLHQIVAVKVLPERFLGDPQLVARFRREMQLIGQLDHPNIVRAFNAGEAEGVYYLVMEFVDGRTLQDVIAEHGPLSLGAACEAIRQAALGLQYAHERGLVHRDIKPSNLMLSRAGVVKILDLGLARCCAGQFSQELTQTGTIMGTGDYMAPEQWENSSQVDVRADLYSLGCTLFYLLTGKPPYADISGGSHREKLLAHAFAPIPSVRAERPDCPEDVDKILAHMMAKSPDDRFDSPAELADAVGLFASAAELRALASEEPVHRPRAGARLGSPETARTVSEPSRRARPSLPWSGRAVPWHRQAGWRVAIVAGLAILAVLGVAAWRWPGSQSGPAGDFTEVRTELSLLPGLNGQWWFDDMPWLLPAVRRSLSERMNSPEAVAAVLGPRGTAHLNPNVLQVQQWLSGVIRDEIPQLAETQRDLAGQLLALSAEQLDDKALEGRLRDCLARLETEDGGVKDLDATDLHARALLEHKLAVLANDKELVGRAAESYDAALAAYEKAAPDTAVLRPLCLSDSARLYSLVLQDYDEASRRFHDATAGRPPLAFLVEALAAWGQAASVAGKYRDEATFVRALELLDNVDLVRESHPLVAHICERYAWSLMDQWDVEGARRQFERAETIRRTNLENSKNPYASVYVYHNRHGQAMALRYQGNAARARRDYTNLLEDVRQELRRAEGQKPRPGQQRFLRDLRERVSNGNERRADCELYEGAASEPKDVDLETACRLYAEARDGADNPGARIAMACKRSIALALRGDGKTARAEYSQQEVSQQPVIGADAERVALLRQLAQAVLVLKEQGVAGRAALERFLDLFDIQANSTDRHRRETLEMQLFAAELLVSSELQAGDAAAAEKHAAYLDGLLGQFRGRPQMLPYLWRHYDLTIRAAGRSEPGRAARHILASRTREARPGLLPPTVSLLLFHLGRREGLAVLRGPERSTAIPLSFGRQAVKDLARGTARPAELRLPDPLLQLIAEERRAGRSIEVHWSDPACWCDPAEALTLQDWPFDAQLKLREAP